jgi:hypothetical protein
MPRPAIFPILLMLAVVLALAPVALEAQVLSPPFLPDTVVGAAYSVPLVIGGAPCAYNWTVLSGGTLPPGLTLGSATSTSSSISGVVGMPTQNIYTFQVLAQPTCAASDVIQSYAIRVLAIQDASFPLQTGIVGQSYSHTFYAWGLTPVGEAGGSAAWSATGLPPGLSMSVLGVVSGVPTTAGTFAGTVTVSTNSGARTTTRPISIVVVAPLAFATPASLPPGTIGLPYSVTIQTSGGIPPVSVSPASGVTPVALGLSYNESTRTISGTPTGAGVYSIALSAIDNSENSVDRTFTVTISPPQVISPAAAPDTAIGASYNVPLTILNGPCSSWVWSLASGAPPPGLSVTAATSPAGAIAGTPGMPAQDIYTFTVRAGTTCASSDGIRSYAIRVLAIKDSGFPVPAGVVGRSYSHTFSAWGLAPVGSVGGTTTWSASGLPPGLTMAASGQILGNPTTAGTFTGSVTVSADGGARTATRPISIVIVPTLTFATPAALPAATVGVPYSEMIHTSGGAPPVNVGTEVATVALGLSYNVNTRTISGTPTGPGTYTIDLYASDASQQSAYRTFTAIISYPHGVIVTESLPSGTIDVPYSATLTSREFLTPPTWSATGLPPGLTLNPSTGLISGSPTTNGAYGVTISAATSTQTALPKTLVLAIGPPALDFTPGILPSGVLGVPYNASFAATGGDGKYVFLAVGAGLPPGLALSPSGAVSGTPGQAGDFKFVVRVTSLQLVTEKQVSMRVDSAPLGLSPDTLGPAYTGEAFSQALVASGGTAPYVFQFGQNSNVPPGLVLSAGGLLAGTPTAAGNFRFSIEVTDARQRRLQRDYTLVVLAAGVISTPSLPEATQGEAYRAVIETSGGTGPFTYDIASGTLPAGLVLTSGGELTGTPAGAGRFAFAVRSTDANQRATTHEYSMQVFAVIVITPDSIPNATLLVDYRAQLTATGGQPGYAWQITNGALPDGILFTDGAFRGAATRAGTFSFDVRVTDQRRRTATRRYSIVVAEGPSIQIDGTVPEGQVGVAYRTQFTSQGGRAPFRWSVTGQLPPGLSLGGADGTITGIPTVVGAFDFTLRVEDADGLAASGPFRITVVLGTVPPATITGISGSTGPNSQTPFGVLTAAPFPMALDGTVVLTFRPDSGADDPAVLFSNGGRQMPFTLPAGSTTANFPVGRAAVQTGTVAGLITLTGSFRLNGADVTPPPAPVSEIRIGPAPPVITRMDAVRTGTGIELSIYGFVTSRQVTQARVTLTAAPGFTLAGTQFTVELSALFTSYYGSAASAPFGSQFRLVLPFTLSDPLGVASVSVTLANVQGSSAASNATF